MAGTTWFLAVAELRRRRTTTILLTLLVAVVVGATLTATAAARRTGTAVDRYLDDYRGMDLLLFGDPDAVADLEENPAVADASTALVFAVFPTEAEGFFPMVSFPDGLIPYERMRAPIVEGRQSDPDAPFEVALGERTSRLLGVGVGDRLPMASFTVEEAVQVFEQGEDRGVEPTGPAFELEVVGIVRDPGDLASRDEDLTLTMLTPAFGDRFVDEIGTMGNLTMVDLVDGATAADLTGGGELPLEVDPAFSRDAVRRQSVPATAALRTGLLALAGAIAVAGLVGIGQAISRVAQGAAVDDHGLRGLGCSRSTRAVRLVAPGTIAVVVGAVAGAALSVLASPLHPIGIARRAEPDPGVDVDPLVLGAGVPLALLAGALTVLLSGWLALRAQDARAGRASSLAGAAARAGAPPAVVSGLQLAGGAGGRHRTPARTAMAAAIAGGVGVLAAVVFAASIDRLSASPELYGWGWDAQIAGSDTTQVHDGGVDEAALLDDPDLDAVAEVVFALPVEIDGEPAQTVAIDDLKGDIEPIVVRGRAPEGPGEIALGGDTLERAGLAIGDAVEVRLEETTATHRIVGVVALPVPTDGGLSAEGAVMTWDNAVDLGFSGSCDGDVSCYRNYALRVAPGVDLDTIRQRYRTDEVTLDRPVAPGEVQQLQAVDRLPWLLAAFLSTLAVVAVGHTAWATVRRRRRDLTVLRCVGFTSSQLRATVAVQVAALVVPGSIVGVLGGVVVGRALWRAVVEGLSLPFAPAVPLPWVLLVPAATLVLSQAVATIPRRAASRLRAADALRVE